MGEDFPLAPDRLLAAFTALEDEAYILAG